ncbi:MAG: hypothetical protein E7620_08340 [Ruminococcaceae bacterium]|nr:hypothetical protein [Oscillospiraceae bacterium]
MKNVMRTAMLVLLALATVLSVCSCQLGGVTPTATNGEQTTEALPTNRETEGKAPTKEPPTEERTPEVEHLPTGECPDTNPSQEETLPDREEDTNGEDTDWKPSEEETVTPEIPGEDTKEPEAPEQTKEPEKTDRPDDPILPPDEEKTTEEEWTSEEFTPDNCPHSWMDGYCFLCDSYCKHIEGAMVCPVCGMDMSGHYVINVNIYKDGEHAFMGTYIDPSLTITVGAAIEVVWGENWADVLALYEVYCDGVEANYYQELFLQADIYLVTRVHEPPAPITDRKLIGVFYPHPEGMEEIPEDYPWFVGYKDLYYEFSTDLSVMEMMQYFGLNPALYEVYVNGVRVENYEETYFEAEISHVFAIARAANFQPYTVTVKDRTGEVEVIRTYAFASPMFYSQIQDQLLNGLDEKSVSVFVEGYHDAIYGSEAGAPFVRDTVVTISLQKETIVVECVDALNNSATAQYEVVGEMPLLAEFAKTYMGIENFEEYVFFDLNSGEARRMAADDRPVYGMVAVSAALLKSEINVSYQISVTDPYSGGKLEHQGSFTMPSPMTVGQALITYVQEVYLDFGTGTYAVTVNGVAVDTLEKGVWFTLIYADAEVEVRSVYTFEVWIEGGDAEPKRLTLESIEGMTLKNLADLLGVDLYAYDWNVNGSTFGEVFPELPLGDLMLNGAQCHLTLIPKRVYVNVTVYDSFGNQMQYPLEIPTVEITLKELAEMLELDANGYNWSYYDPMLGQSFDSVSPDTALTSFPVWFGYGCYDVKAVSVSYQIMVQLGDSGELMELTFEGPVTVSELLDQLGLKWEEISMLFFEDYLNGGSYQLMEDSVIMGYGLLRVELMSF